MKLVLSCGVRDTATVKKYVVSVVFMDVVLNSKTFILAS